MKKLNCTFSREESNINLSNQPTYRQLDMKLIKVTKVDDELLEHLTACYLLLSVGEEVVIPYEREWELELEELGIEFTVVKV